MIKLCNEVTINNHIFKENSLPIKFKNNIISSLSEILPELYK